LGLEHLAYTLEDGLDTVVFHPVWIFDRFFGPSPVKELLLALFQIVLLEVVAALGRITVVVFLCKSKFLGLLVSESSVLLLLVEIVHGFSKALFHSFDDLVFSLLVFLELLGSGQFELREVALSLTDIFNHGC